MVEIRNEVKGAVLKLVEDDVASYVYVSDIMAKMWDDYIREAIGDVYARGVLKDLLFTDTQVFCLMERLQVGRSEYIENDYRENAYI